MFDVSPSYAIVSKNRTYALRKTHSGVSGQVVRQGRYVGPALDVILPKPALALPLEAQAALAVLEVPGLPEVCILVSSPLVCAHWSILVCSI